MAKGEAGLASDLCALTDEMLPLYAEGVLDAGTRRLIDDHAVECPACRERLNRAVASLAPPPGAGESRDEYARLMSARIRRILVSVVIGMLVVLIGVGGLRYAAARKQPGVLDGIPARVTSAEQVAARAIPGWNRAKAAGLVVDLGVTDKIPGTAAAITLDKAWYSGRQAYILYTVKAPKGGYLMPTRVWLGDANNANPFTEGDTDWTHLKQWGGFSSEGFHSVISFPALSPPADLQQLQVTVVQWAPVTPEAGLDEQHNPGSRLSLLLPWRAAYLQEPTPDVKGGHYEQTWLGRKLIVEDVAVGIGHIKLTGSIALPPGEQKPVLMAELQVGDQTLSMKEFKAEPIGASPAWSDFTATFDGPNEWPAPVTLAISGIGFETDKTLEWPVNWAKYRDRQSSADGLMDPADQVSVPFYDSELISIMTASSGVAIEQKEPTVAPPYVRAALRGGGRGAADHPGMEVVNAAGEVLTNIGGGGGTIYDDPKTHDQRQGIAAMWWDQLPENFRQSDRLVIRYVQPSAALILKESWELRADCIGDCANPG